MYDNSRINNIIIIHNMIQLLHWCNIKNKIEIIITLAFQVLQDQVKEINFQNQGVHKMSAYHPSPM